MCLVYMCVPVRACGCQRLTWVSFLHHFLPYAVGTGFLTEPGAHQFGYTGWHACSGDLEICRICPSLGARHVLRHLASYLGTRDQYNAAVHLPLSHLLQLLDIIFSY